MKSVHYIVQIVLAAAAVALIAYFFVPSQETAPKRGRGPNVLLVIVDTLRPDWLSCYGMDAYKTPHVDALAARGVLFEDAVCQYPATLPSHASIFTSQYAYEHGVRDNSTKLPKRARTLAQIFADAGWHTGGFVSNFVLQAKTRIGRGFETYDDALPDHEANRDQPERIAEKTTDAALAWLGANPAGFFLFVHYQDPHGPYMPPDRWTGRTKFHTGKTLPLSEESNPTDAVPNYQILDGSGDVDRYLAGYAGEIQYVDEQIGRLLSEMTRMGAMEDTFVVLTSDHGEALGEHGRWFQHATSLYQPQLRVPLIVAGPGIEPARVDRLVQTIDIMPTLLELTGIDDRPAMQGRSLVPLLSGRSPRELEFGYGELFGAETARRLMTKLVVDEAGNPSLFDLAADPAENLDLAVDQPAAVGVLTSMIRALKADRLNLEPVPVERIDDRDTREKLKALGYVQ